MTETPTTDGMPLYLEISLALRGRVERGELAPGQKLAGERTLAREYGASPVTLSRALGVLVRDGLLVRRAGSGTYVCEALATLEADPGRSRVHNEILVDTSPIDQPLFNHYMGPVMDGIRLAAEAHGCVVRFLDGKASGALTPAELGPRQGLLLLAPLADRADAAEELARTRPVVACGVQWPDRKVPSVDSDNVDAARQVVDYLARLGHQRILLLTSPDLRTDTRDRRAGFRLATAEHGLESDLQLEAEGPEALGNAGRQGLRALMLGRDAPTALFATDYMLALEAMARLREMGLHLPNDVSVVGFDDPVSAAYLSPPLTTVRQPLRRMGRQAAEMLLDLIDHGVHECPAAVFPCSLIVRGSCRSTRHE